MYRIQIFLHGNWVWGTHDYTAEQAVDRLEQLMNVGIVARIRPSSELFN